MSKKNRIREDASVGEILRNLRKKSKLTQADMAQRVGVAEWLYSKYEKDITPMPLELVSKLKAYEDFDMKWMNLLLIRAYCEAVGEQISKMPLEDRMDALAGIMNRMRESAEKIENTTID